MHRIALALAALGLASGPAAAQDLPIRGRAIPELTQLDQLMRDTMDANGITAGVLGVRFEGRTVYMRSFGWQDRDRTTPLPHDAMLRLASVTKPITASIIDDLVRDGDLALTDNAFDLGQPGGGILDLEPFPLLGDGRLEDIAVFHLLQHRAGWDRAAAGNHMFRDIQIAGEMGIPSPPGATNMMRWILGQPLQFSPGTGYVYSNLGYLALGLIIEEVTGDAYGDAVERLFADLGVPGQVEVGRTFAADHNPLEPWYDQEDIGFAVNVYDPAGERVRWPYGGWNHEGARSVGGLIATAEAILRLADSRVLFGTISGRRRTGSEGPSWFTAHSGSLPGTDTVAWQRGNGVSIVVLFNHRDQTFRSAWSVDVAEEIDQRVLRGEIAWPPCAPDLDRDGELTLFDFLAFSNLFDDGSMEVDYDGDGALTLFDFLEFQNLFQDGGC
ncbi:MAG: serine hydrolase domain-containing protein [Planctomycetota bacterium]